jgi:ribose transport system substrate-binding protein
MWTWSRLGLCISLSLVLAGCGGQANQSTGGSPAGGQAAAGKAKPKLLFISNSNSDWWSAVEKGMTDGGKEFGAEVELRRNEGQPQGQIEKLEEALGLADVDGVAVSVIEADSPGVYDAMKRLQEAGKVVITVDSDITPSKADARRAYIGTNNVKAGEVAGKVAAALRPKGGTVAVFVGTAAAANARERRDGFFAGAGPAFKQVEIFEDQTDKNRAQVNVQTAINKYPDLGLLLGLWSYNAAAIAEEVGNSEKVRKNTNVVTFDLDELAVDHVVAGRIDATICQNPYEMGYLGVRLLKALINKDEATIKEVLPNGPIRETGVRVVVPKPDSPVKGKVDNVIDIEEMKSWLASKGLKST